MTRKPNRQSKPGRVTSDKTGNPPGTGGANTNLDRRVTIEVIVLLITLTVAVVRVAEYYIVEFSPPPRPSVPGLHQLPACDPAVRGPDGIDRYSYPNDAIFHCARS
jgi:hypothetical protein